MQNIIGYRFQSLRVNMFLPRKTIYHQKKPHAIVTNRYTYATAQESNKTNISTNIPKKYQQFIRVSY